jgi:hypothetical protein
MLDSETAVRYEEFRNGSNGLWFSKCGKVKYDESDREDVEIELKYSMDKLFNCILNGRKYKDLPVIISTDWNALNKVTGPAFDIYLSPGEDEFYKGKKFKYARHCRLIEFI